MQRDITTSRRVAVLAILWHERYLSRSPLIANVELRLGKNCFGISAWEDNFYRDMRLVKQAGIDFCTAERRNNPAITCRGNPR